jgi:hypothetical protein
MRARFPDRLLLQGARRVPRVPRVPRVQFPAHARTAAIWSSSRIAASARKQAAKDGERKLSGIGTSIGGLSGEGQTPTACRSLARAHRLPKETGRSRPSPAACSWQSAGASLANASDVVKKYPKRENIPIHCPVEVASPTRKTLARTLAHQPVRARNEPFMASIRSLLGELKQWRSGLPRAFRPPRRHARLPPPPHPAGGDPDTAGGAGAVAALCADPDSFHAKHQQHPQGVIGATGADPLGRWQETGRVQAIQPGMGRTPEISPQVIDALIATEDHRFL